MGSNITKIENKVYGIFSACCNMIHLEHRKIF